MFFSKLSVQEVADRLYFIWNALVGVGLVTYILQYKLNTDIYFREITDYVDHVNLYLFFIDQWETIVLGFIFLISYLVVTLESSKWRAFGQAVFAPEAMPTNFFRVRNRYIILWVILSNIAIFVAIVAFIESLLVFCILFALHHVNAVLWVWFFRQNVDYYFEKKEYQPSEHNINRDFIIARRQVVKDFLNKSAIVVKDSAFIIMYIIIAAMEYGSLLANTDTRILVISVMVFTKMTGEYVLWRMCARRDEELHVIEEKQTLASRKREEETFA